MDNNSLTLVNNSKFKGNKRWSWKVWLEGPDKEIENVKSVRYFLHPTFRNPIVLIEKKENNFRLSGSGWGEFNIRAEVNTLSNEIILLNHWLTFDVTATRGIQENNKAQVFISHSNSDGPFASILAGKLINEELNVVASAISEPDDLKNSISKTEDKNHLNLVLISPGMGEFVETYYAQNLPSSSEINNNTLFVLLGPAELDLGTSKLNTINVKTKSEIPNILNSVNEMLNFGDKQEDLSI